MRENMGIYRGKRKDTGEWVEGNLIESDNSHYPMVLIGHVITSRDKHTNALSFDGFDLCEVDPSTVGQFTGLLDKNGERIFEGDVVRFMERRLGGKDVPVVEVVEFSEGGFATNRYFLNNWLRDSKKGNTQLQDIEVVGNRVDSSELLEVSEND